MSLPLVSFAVQSTGQLFQITEDIAQWKIDAAARQFLTTLRGVLLAINEALKAISSIPDQRVTDRITALLTNLERLCQSLLNYMDFMLTVTQWPARERRSQRLVEGLNPARRFSVLAQLPRNSREVTANVARFASQRRLSPNSPDPRISLLEILRKFPALESRALTYETPTVRTGQMGDSLQEDYHPAVRSLYETLFRYCRCSNNDSYIGVKLRLTIEKSSDAERPSFNVLFVVHPHQDELDMDTYWQVTTISVVPPDHCSGRELQASIGEGEFCTRVCYSRKSPLSLILAESFLAFTKDDEAPKRWITTRPSVSLGDILGEYHVGKQPRYLLMFLLARALWQFHDTNWMQIPWTVDNVQFLVERRNVVGVFLNEPFLSASFIPDPTGKQQQPSPEERFRSIRAFGVMLLEIELGILMRNAVRELPDYEEISVEDQLSQEAYAAQILVEDTRAEDVFTPLSDAIRFCLKPDNLQLYCNEPGALRVAIYQNIVSQVVGLVTVLLKNPDAVVLHQPALPKGTAPSRKGNVKNTPSKPLALPPTRSHSTNPEILDSEQWFGDLARLNSVLQAHTGEKALNRDVRIVILDTGLDGSSRYAKAISGYKDFVSSKDDVKTDITGHGTRAVEIIFKVLNQAKVFVGRVFETDVQNDKTQGLMEKAIEWAYTKCKADIISMASGFQDEHAGMKKQIKQAALSGALVFAAASNYGNMRRVTFPGSMRHYVFCIYATDANAKIAGRAASINPPGRVMAPNFALLGENIVLSGGLLLGDPPLTGTSYATSIAAGLAARLLDFSRQEGPAARIRKLEDLQTFEGMEAVFMKLATPSAEYKCIVPWRLIENCTEEHRDEQRRRVCDAISDALENKDKF